MKAALRAALAAIVLLVPTLGSAASPVSAAEITQIPAAAGQPAIPLYVVRPDGPGPFPAVVLLHGCTGFNGFLAVGADRLAQHGYVAVAPDALSANKLTDRCETPHDAIEAAAARAALAWLRAQPFVAADRLGIVGFSMGADAALDLVDAHGAKAPAGLRAVAIYYPSCEGRDGLVDVPVTIFDGDADKIAPSSPCTAMARAASAAGKPVSITTYPGATHGFDVPGPDRTFYGEPIRFDPSAALDAARQTLSLLTRYLGP